MVPSHPEVVHLRVFARLPQTLHRHPRTILARQSVAHPQLVRRDPLPIHFVEQVLTRPPNHLTADPHLEDHRIVNEDLLHLLPFHHPTSIELVLSRQLVTDPHLLNGNDPLRRVDRSPFRKARLVLERPRRPGRTRHRTHPARDQGVPQVDLPARRRLLDQVAPDPTREPRRPLPTEPRQRRRPALHRPVRRDQAPRRHHPDRPAQHPAHERRRQRRPVEVLLLAEGHRRPLTRRVARRRTHPADQHLLAERQRRPAKPGQHPGHPDPGQRPGEPRHRTDRRPLERLVPVERVVPRPRVPLRPHLSIKGLPPSPNCAKNEIAITNSMSLQNTLRPKRCHDMQLIQTRNTREYVD